MLLSNETQFPEEPHSKRVLHSLEACDALTLWRSISTRTQHTPTLSSSTLTGSRSSTSHTQVVNSKVLQGIVAKAKQSGRELLVSPA